MNCQIIFLIDDTIFIDPLLHITIMPHIAAFWIAVTFRSISLLLKWLL